MNEDRNPPAARAEGARREPRRRLRLVLAAVLAAGLLGGVVWSYHLLDLQERATGTIADLGPEELVSAVAARPLVFVYFYSPTCPYCLEATPILTGLAGEMKLPLVGFNIREHPETASLFRVPFVPAVYAFSRGRLLEVKLGLDREDGYRLFFQAIRDTQFRGKKKGR